MICFLLLVARRSSKAKPGALSPDASEPACPQAGSSVRTQRFQVSPPRPQRKYIDMFGAPFGFELKVSADAPDLVRMLKFDCPWCISNSELKVSALPSGGCYLSFPPWRGLIYRTFKFDCPWCMGAHSFSECPGPGSYAQVRLPMVYVNALICLGQKKKKKAFW